MFAVKMDRLMTIPVMLNVRRSKSNAMANVRVRLVARNSAFGGSSIGMAGLIAVKMERLIMPVVPNVRRSKSNAEANVLVPHMLVGPVEIIH